MIKNKMYCFSLILLSIIIILTSTIPVLAMQDANKTSTNLFNKEIIVGDVDLNGVVSILDVLKIQYYLVDMNIDNYLGENVYTNSNKTHLIGDVDGNGIINIVDATKIQYYLAELLDSEIGANYGVAVDINSINEYYKTYFTSEDFGLSGQNIIVKQNDEIVARANVALDETAVYSFSTQDYLYEINIIENDKAYIKKENLSNGTVEWSACNVSDDVLGKLNIDALSDIIENYISKVESINFYKFENNMVILDVVVNVSESEIEPNYVIGKVYIDANNKKVKKVIIPDFIIVECLDSVQTIDFTIPENYKNRLEIIVGLELMNALKSLTI